MPILAQLLVGLFGALAGFFARLISVKVAFGLAAISVFALLTVAMVAVISTAITAIAWGGVLPPAVILGFSFFMPSNFPLVISTIIAAEIAAALYRWNNRQLELFTWTS